MNKLKFIVTVQHKMYDKIATFMGAMDLGITGITAGDNLEVTYETTSVVDMEYIKKMKKAIGFAIETAYVDFRVLEVKYIG